MKIPTFLSISKSINIEKVKKNITDKEKEFIENKMVFQHFGYI